MITDKQAIESLKILDSYCLEHSKCEKCIFKPVDYRVPNYECYFRKCTPCDTYADYLKEKGIN